MAAFFQSVRVRLVALVLLAIVPALGMALWTGLEHRGSAQQRAGERALQLVYYSSLRYETLLDTTAALLRDLAHRPEVIQLRLPECRELFTRQLADRPAYGNIALAAPDGKVVC